MNFLKRLISGAVIGVANIIPGVSGGTMAVILNIYDKLISSLSGFTKNIKKNFIFLLPIGLGAVIGILLFAKGINYLLNNHNMIINFLFLGLVIGSIPMIYKKAVSTKFNPLSLIPFFVMLGIMVITVLLSSGDDSNKIITSLNFSSFIWIVISLSISSACMIIPGISGSTMMLIFGVYSSVTTAISDKNILILIPVAIGCLIGVLGGSKLIDILIKKFHQATYFGILGLLVGSIFAIYSESEPFTFNFNGLIGIFILIIGILMAYFLGSRIKENGVLL